jgi:hypothetical protein
MCVCVYVSDAFLCVCGVQVHIDTKEKFERLEAEERAYYQNMVGLCKASGANLIICQVFGGYCCCVFMEFLVALFCLVLFSGGVAVLLWCCVLLWDACGCVSGASTTRRTTC